MSVQVLLLASVRVLLLPPPVNFGRLDHNLDPQGAEWNSGLNLFGFFHTKVALDPRQNYDSAVILHPFNHRN